MTRTYLAKNLRVAENNDTVLCAGEGDVETPWIVQETYTLVLIASHAAENNIILLSALERVDAGDFDFLVEILLQRAIELHVIHDVRSLAFVRGYHANLTGHYARFEKFRDDFFHVRRFGSIGSHPQARRRAKKRAGQRGSERKNESRSCLWVCVGARCGRNTSQSHVNR